MTSHMPPGQPYQQPYAQQPQQVALGHLRVYLQGSSMTSSMITPTLMLNNQQVKASYGPNDYHLPAGQYRVSAYAQWMRRYGQASLDVMLPPSATVEVYYAPPMHQFTVGSMGFTKQRRNGAVFMIGLMVFVVLSILVPLILSLVWS